MSGIIILESDDVLQANLAKSVISTTSANPADRNLSLVDLGKKLLEAARIGETEEVKSLMTNGAPFTTDWLGTSPLHMAAQYGHLGTAEVLIRAGISRDARTKVDRTPLHVAAQEGHLEIVDLLLKNGADVDAKDMLKMTPLHWAVERGHIDVTQLLLDYCADVQCQSKFDKTPIDVAIENERLDLAQMLTSSGSMKRRMDEGTETETMILKDEEDDEVEGVDEDLEDSVEANLSVIDCDPSLNRRRTAKIELKQEESGEALSNLHWIEQGLMMPQESTIIANAIEGGQTISLTEAGRMALNWTKMSSISQKSPKSLSNQKVITIVTDQNQIPSLISDGGNSIVVTDPESLIALEKEFRETTSSVKKFKRNDVMNEPLDNYSSLSHEELARKLEETQRIAKEFEIQLRKTKQEAANYKRKYETLSATSGTIKK